MFAAAKIHTHAHTHNLPSPFSQVLEQLGVPFSLGTDNLMINTPDMFREMESAYRHHLYSRSYSHPHPHPSTRGNETDKNTAVTCER
jgi:cytosine/adenosine deaminase-related metal-dependent hydrolase